MVIIIIISIIIGNVFNVVIFIIVGLFCTSLKPAGSTGGNILQVQPEVEIMPK
jgi:hypothetical protein